jgi:hypothetical protein
MAPGEDLLVFDYAGLASRSATLFEELNASSELADRFLEDPTGVLSERVLSLPEPLAASDVEETNRFLFSLLSNREFIDWAEKWQKSHEDAIRALGEGDEERVEVRIDRNELFRDLADAIHKYGDPAALRGLTPLDFEGDEEIVSTTGAPAELLAEESRIKLPRPPKPVNFNVAVNATVGVSVAGAVAAVVVFVVVIPVVVIGRVESETADREDLQRLAATLTEELSQRAVELRKRDELGPGLSA